MTDWFVPVPTEDDPPTGAALVRLVVFPHAGGGPASLGTLTPHLPATVEPWSVNLPGRQARLSEPPRTDLDPLVDELATHLAGSVPPPYALFGYCSGALLAYLVGRRLDERDQPPCRLLVGSAAAPDVAAPPRRLHTLPSELFWEQLLDFGGVPPELAEREQLRPVLEPALRADFALQAGYHHRPGPPMRAPVTVLHGRHDRSLTRGGLLGWRRHTRARPQLRELEASHWLVEDAPAALGAAIGEALAADIPAAAPD